MAVWMIMELVSPKKNMNKSISSLHSPSAKSDTISRCESAPRTRGSNKKFGSPIISHYKRTAFNDDVRYALKRLGIKTYNDIILDDRTKQKYFAANHEYNTCRFFVFTCYQSKLFN